MTDETAVTGLHLFNLAFSELQENLDRWWQAVQRARTMRESLPDVSLCFDLPFRHPSLREIEKKRQLAWVER